MTPSARINVLIPRTKLVDRHDMVETRDTQTIGFLVMLCRDDELSGFICKTNRPVDTSGLVGRWTVESRCKMANLVLWCYDSDAYESL